MTKEQERLEKVSKKVRQSLANAPEGTLRLSKCHGCTQYYHCTENSPHKGVYIPKNNIKLAKRLAQKAYDEKVLSYTEKCITQIKRLLKNFEDDKINEIYASEHIERQKLITPVEPTYDQRLNEWLAESYQGKGFAEGAPVITSNNGIRVRSKSEKIMADYFESIGLEYKYECPIYLKSYGTIYPDFTFLSRKSGKIVYWEHEGMMDNPDYARSAVQKIELYERNGLFPGEDLILTFETSASIINTELMKELTMKYLL